MQFPSQVHRLIYLALGGMTPEQLATLVQEVEALSQSSLTPAQRAAVDALDADSTPAEIVAALQA